MLSKVRKLTRLVDYFEDSGRAYCVLQTVGQQTLTSVMREVYHEGCDEHFAKRTIASIGSILKSMHKLGFVHRRINADAIGMRLSVKQSEAALKSVYKVEYVGVLDHVTVFHLDDDSASKTS